jgi:hypothetical protein
MIRISNKLVSSLTQRGIFIDIFPYEGTRIKSLTFRLVARLHTNRSGFDPGHYLPEWT